jgi:hypothetical protein
LAAKFRDFPFLEEDQFCFSLCGGGRAIIFFLASFLLRIQGCCGGVELYIRTYAGVVINVCA